jgi:ribosomal protein S18 acetylase RimI-like enzyme
VLTACTSHNITVDIRIRKCRPDDAAFLARSILIAGRAHVSKGIWEVVLNTTEEECLRFLEHIIVTEVPHLFHYSCSLLAETTESIPVGSLGGYDPQKSGYFALQQALPEVYKKLDLPEHTFQEASDRASKILSCLPKEIDKAWVIDSVATMPEYRGRGIAERLLQAILDEGRKQGYSLAQINMYAGNEPALRLYKKLGFEVIEETQDKYFEKEICSSGMISLIKKI